MMTNECEIARGAMGGLTDTRRATTDGIKRTFESSRRMGQPVGINHDSYESRKGRPRRRRSLNLTTTLSLSPCSSSSLTHAPYLPGSPLANVYWGLADYLDTDVFIVRPPPGTP